MYAIVEIAGKQYKVRENDKLYVPLLNAEVDDTVTFDRVLLVADGDDIKVGTPVVDKALVEARVVDHVKGDKVLVFKKIRRKRFKVLKGHRQKYTQIQVSGLSLNGAGKKKAKKGEDEAPEAPAAQTSGKAAATKESGKAAAAKKSGKKTGKAAAGKDTAAASKAGEASKAAKADEKTSKKSDTGKESKTAQSEAQTASKEAKSAPQASAAAKGKAKKTEGDGEKPDTKES